jgi:hypothetical protein
MMRESYANQIRMALLFCAHVIAPPARIASNSRRDHGAHRRRVFCGFRPSICGTRKRTPLNTYR